MLVDKINVAKWFHAQSPSFPRFKEGDLPLLNFSNLTCMTTNMYIAKVNIIALKR